MHRPFWWIPLVAVALVMAPLAGFFVAPASSVAAGPAAPVAVADDELVLLTSTGQVRIDDLHTEPGITQVVWNSGSEVGWQRVAAGDFNGDGDDEIVVTSGGRIKIYDPVVQSGSVQSVLDFTLGGGRSFRLIITGDFDGDGRDEIATTHTESGTNIQEAVKVFDGGTNGTNWTVAYEESFAAPWEDISAGDVNHDGKDDLALVRQPGKVLKVYNGGTWTNLFQNGYSKPWLTVAVGNLDSAYAGDELAMTRTDVLDILNSVILFRWTGSTMDNLVANANYKYYPNFGSVALGDLNGDGDQEVVLLRDPVADKTSVLMINPAGATMRAFQQTIGYGATAWKLVRAGDFDADGRDEIVLLRGTGYRVYNDPQANDLYTDVAGNFYVSATTANVPTMAVANVDGAGQVLGPSLALSTTQLSFDLEFGEPSPTQTINITNAGAAATIAWQAQIIEGAAWLRLDKTSGSTPSTLGVSVDTTAVAPGTHTGRIRIAATSGGVANSPQDVTVNLSLQGVSMAVSPALLSFTVEYGASSPEQTLTIASAGGGSQFGWQATTLQGASWIRLSATSGTTPSTVKVTVDSTAAGPGTHSGAIRVDALDAQVAQPTQYVTVELTVPDPGFLVTPNQVFILQRVGGPAVTKDIEIFRAGATIDWVATAVPTLSMGAVADGIASDRVQASAAGVSIDGIDVNPPAWLVFTPDHGQTPSTMTVSVNTDVPGTYHAVILVVAVDPDTPHRVYSVDVTALVVAEFNYLPFVPRE